MASTQNHYDQHLGPIYEWMVGDFEQAVQSSSEFFRSVGITSGNSQQAIDLGCGHGLQALPLAEAGYEVVAIDSCQHLLDSLSQRAGEKKIRLVRDDLMNFVSHATEQVGVIVCMGDTLTHLSSVTDALAIIQSAAQKLFTGGKLCLSFRDYTGDCLEDIHRFIPVRATEERIHTCFLEDKGAFLQVTDLLHTQQQGEWKLTASSYPKIKLSPDEVKQTAKDCQLTLTDDRTVRGMRYLTFQR